MKKEDVVPYYKEERVMVIDLSATKSTKNEIEMSRTNSMQQTSSLERGEDVVDNVSAEVSLDLTSHTVYTPTTIESEMLTIKTFSQLNEYISQGKQKGVIRAAGKYSTLPLSGLSYAFIYNREGKVPACIKIQDGKGTNLQTGASDAIKEYKGCGAIWIQLK